MFRFRRQPSHCFIDHRRPERMQLRATLSLHPLGKSRAGRDARRATTHLVTHLAHKPVLESRRQPQNISARRVGDFHRHRRRRKFPHIPWILKMIEQRRGVHLSFILENPAGGRPNATKFCQRWDSAGCWWGRSLICAGRPRPALSRAANPEGRPQMRNRLPRIVTPSARGFVVAQAVFPSVFVARAPAPQVGPRVTDIGPKTSSKLFRKNRSPSGRKPVLAAFR